MRKTDPGLSAPPPVLARTPLEPPDEREHEHQLAFVGVRLFDGTRTFEKTTVITEGSTIKAVGPGLTPPPSAQVIEGAGYTLLPGFIDAHTHVEDEGDLEQALRLGVTTEVVMAGNPWFFQKARATPSNDRAAIFSAGSALTVVGGHGTQFGPDIPAYDGSTPVEEFVQARFHEGSQFLKIIYDHYRPTLSIADLQAAVRVAHEKGAMVVAHVSDAQEAAHVVHAGADGLAHIWWRAPAQMKDQTLAMMKERNVFVVTTLTALHNLCSQSRASKILESDQLSSQLSQSAKAKLRASFGPRPPGCSTGDCQLSELLGREIPVLAGTDAGVPGTAHGASLHDELALLNKGGMSPTQALRSATSLPADALGLPGRGHISAGMIADLVLVKGNPMHDIHRTKDIAGVWKSGAQVAR